MQQHLDPGGQYTQLANWPIGKNLNYSMDIPKSLSIGLDILNPWNSLVILMVCTLLCLLKIMTTGKKMEEMYTIAVMLTKHSITYSVDQAQVLEEIYSVRHGLSLNKPRGSICF